MLEINFYLVLVRPLISCNNWWSNPDWPTRPITGRILLIYGNFFWPRDANFPSIFQNAHFTQSYVVNSTRQQMWRECKNFLYPVNVVYEWPLKKSLHNENSCRSRLYTFLAFQELNCLVGLIVIILSILSPNHKYLTDSKNIYHRACVYSQVFNNRRVNP